MTTPPHDGSTSYGWPAAEPTPAPPATNRPGTLRTRTLALLLAAMVGAGATGAGVTLLASGGDGGSSAASVQQPSSVSTASTDTAAPAAGSPEAAAAIIGPSVVTVRETGSQTSAGPFGQQQQQSVSGTGSGIVLNKDGYIVTNNHVVAAAVDGGSVSVLFSEGRVAPAKIVGTDPTSDLAVIKVEASDQLTPATFADSSTLAVGQAVLAVGAPLGLSNTVTQGIVSTLHRPVRTGESGASEQSVIDAVQTDAAINPGNSGGALVNLAGKVVGLNSAIATTGGSSGGAQAGNIGVGFAIPANDVVEVAKELIATGKAEHPQLGISVSDTPDGSGALARQVSGPAAAAGLRQGDVITKVDNRAVVDADSLIVAVRSHDPGQEVTVTYVRGGDTRTAKATLATAPAE